MVSRRQPGTLAVKINSIKTRMVVGATLLLMLVIPLDIICHRIKETSTRCIIISRIIHRIMISTSMDIITKASNEAVVVAEAAIRMLAEAAETITHR